MALEIDRSAASPDGSRTSARIAARVIAPALALLLVGCGGPLMRYRHEHSLSPGKEFHAGLETALVIPVNYLNDDPVRGLEVADQRLMDSIVRHLESKGIEVERAEAAKFRKTADAIYRAILAERKSGESDVVSAGVKFEDALPKILEKLDASPDLVISPNTLMRTAEWNGTRTLVWDGVRRRDDSAGAYNWTGTSNAASLQALVYSGSGERVFVGYGGLDLVFQFNSTKKIMEIRENLLADQRNIDEGVCIAFYPYFGLEESCAR